jgi:uncharacterized protein with HEPN domain
MADAAEKIHCYTEGASFEDFASDQKTIDAVARNLEILGEAAKNVPDFIRQANSQVDWSRLAGLRDILIHQYFGVDLVIIWDIVQNKLPILRMQINQILSS